MRYLLPLLPLLITACSALAPSKPQPYPDIHEDLAAHRYGEALAEIKALFADGIQDQALQRLRNEAIYQAFRFEQQTVAEATTYQEEGDWGGALRVLDEALASYPESQMLQNTRKRFRAQQEQQLASLDTDLMLARVGWLLKQKNILLRKRSLGRALDRSESNQLERIDVELARLHQPLIDQGTRALKRGRLGLAKRCLSLAEQIGTNSATRRLRAATDKLSRQREKREQARKQKAQALQREALEKASRERFLDHLERARTALAQNDLLAARQSVMAAAAIQAGHPDLQALAEAVQRRVSQRTEALITEGNSLYSRGDFREARDLWAEAVRLDPENTLARARLERAERVLNTLDRLRKEQSGQ
ncbi:MAG: hypothetical protein Kow006_24610 [Gammaproteobacteria bacterium]